MHHLAGGLPHRVLRDLAEKYGPLMDLHLGEVSAIVVKSPDMAKQVFKTHDIDFASRPKLLAMDIICYDRRDITFCPYVLSAKNVRSFSSIRHDEVVRLIDSIQSSSSSGEPVNFTERIIWFTSSMTCRSTFGQVLKEQQVFIKLIREVISLAEGFEVADIFPSYKFLHGFGGAKQKLLNAHRGEDLVDVLLRLMNDKCLQFPINNDNIKDVIIDLLLEQKLHQQQLYGL
ncbi:hypothetical protein RDI58_010947 [Solanum bulbocastanum]|uniref:Cytochrome P450 n=1 Tax=Solanum bulbocastanum TaxID=147425 RepID=A0AAN8TUQ1_SOLBU